MSRNNHRAARVLQLIRHHPLDRSAPDADDAAEMRGLLIDLMHLAGALGVSWVDLSAEARRRYNLDNFADPKATKKGLTEIIEKGI